MASLRTFRFMSVLLVAACDPVPPPPSVASVPSVEAALDGGILWLQGPPPGALPENADLLEPERTFGDPEIEFGRVKDVAVDANGRIFVADNASREIRSLTETGEPVGTLGRTGAGPGEFQSPEILVRTGPYLVVGQPRPQNSLLVFDVETLEEVGRFHFGTRTDWGRWTSRHPLLNPDGDQQGSEDASWRVAAASDTSLVLLLRPNDLREDGTPVPPAEQTASLVELHLPDGPVDTLRTLPGTPVHELETMPGPECWSGSFAFYRPRTRRPT